MFSFKVVSAGCFQLTDIFGPLTFYYTCFTGRLFYSNQLIHGKFLVSPATNNLIRVYNY